MDRKFVDYKYASDLQVRINRLVEHDSNLKDMFLWKGWNLWQSYQGALFSDTKLWSKERKLSQIPLGFIGFFKLFLASTITFAISSCALVVSIFISKKIAIFTEDK